MVDPTFVMRELRRVAWQGEAWGRVVSNRHIPGQYGFQRAIVVGRQGLRACFEGEQAAHLKQSLGWPPAARRGAQPAVVGTCTNNTLRTWGRYRKGARTTRPSPAATLHLILLVGRVRYKVISTTPDPRRLPLHPATPSTPAAPAPVS